MSDTGPRTAIILHLCRAPLPCRHSAMKAWSVRNDRSLPSIMATREMLCPASTFPGGRLGTNLYNTLLYLPGTYQVVVQMRRDHDTTRPRRSCRRTLSLLLSLLLCIIITRHPTARCVCVCVCSGPHCLGTSRRGPPGLLVSSVISLLQLLIRPDPSSSTQKGSPALPRPWALGHDGR